MNYNSKNKNEKIEKSKAQEKIEETKKDKVNTEETQKIENENNVEKKEHTKLIKFEEIKNIFRKKKKIPKEERKKIHKPVWINIAFTLIVLLYFSFLIIGFYNIDKNVYQIDLKVFSLCILFFAIILLERAYKKDNGRIAIYGIETIIISIITLGLIYVNLMMSSTYIKIVLIILGVAVVYYLIKSIIINIRGRKKYFINNMKEMINTEE